MKRKGNLPLFILPPDFFEYVFMPRFRSRINTSAFLSATRLPTPPPLFFSTTPGAVTFHLYENAPSTAVHRTIPFPLIRKKLLRLRFDHVRSCNVSFVRKCSFNRVHRTIPFSLIRKKISPLFVSITPGAVTFPFVRKCSFNRVHRTIPFPLIREKLLRLPL